MNTFESRPVDSRETPEWAKCSSCGDSIAPALTRMFGELVIAARTSLGSEADTMFVEQITFALQAWLMNRTGEDGDAWIMEKLRVQSEEEHERRNAWRRKK